MTEAAAAAAAAVAAPRVLLVTSGDEKHPPENITDGKTETFWMSTGLFPQEFIIRLSSSALKISLITVYSYNVKGLKIEKSTSNDIAQFEPLAEKEFECTEGHLQTNDFSLATTSATHLRFIITSGYDHFISVHKVTVDGKYE